MVLRIDIRDIEDKVLSPLNEILLLSYGTEMYKHILGRIEKIVTTLESQHLIYKRWQ